MPVTVRTSLIACGMVGLLFALGSARVQTQAPGAPAKVAMPPAPSPSELQVAVEREIERRKAAAEEEAAQRKKAAQQAEIERRKTEPKKAKLDRLLAQRSEMVQAGKKAMTDPDTGEKLTLEELHTRIGQLGSW